MKYRIENLDSAQYLNMVNQEENPSGDKLDIHYYKIGDNYIVFASTAFGKFMSPLYHPSPDSTEAELEKVLEEDTEAIKQKYTAISDKQIAPKLLTF
ncbi:hypothetical protein [Acinetobacter sp.]|uniref:hypothetical protein n=1 Tax=Acinetobacter sp. TaxID=472 RepID=UPI003752F741